MAITKLIRTALDRGVHKELIDTIDIIDYVTGI